VARNRIRKGDYLFAWVGAAVSGIAGVTVVALVGGMPLGYAIGAIVMILASAAFAAIPLSRDIATLHERASNIGVEVKFADPAVYWTPLGGGLARQLQDSRRRVISVQRAMETRADDAERVIDALPEALFVLDARRRIMHANRAAEDIFGQDLAGRNLAQVLRNPRLLQAVERCLANGQSAEIELEIMSPVVRTLEAHVRPLPHQGAGGNALLVTLQDLTAIRRVEQMRVDFVANVSHELRTPLTSLGGFVETMQTVAKDDSAAQERFLAIMATETQRMNRLVEDLLSLSRIELEEHNPPEAPVKLRPIVDSVLDMLQPIAKEYGTAVSVEIPDDLPPVTGDKDQLAQVVRNLLENAIKYGRQGGSVQIRGRAEGRMVAVAFRDDGDGIPREVQYRLTERFYRVEKARSRKVGGTGLGLAIVKHIVNRHRGRLQIESDLGQGSTFTIYLPKHVGTLVSTDAVTKAS
jgi:two-component system phosphate regulon sensor histidine kinase PhoR